MRAYMVTTSMINYTYWLLMKIPSLFGRRLTFYLHDSYYLTVFCFANIALIAVCYIFFFRPISNWNCIDFWMSRTMKLSVRVFSFSYTIDLRIYNDICLLTICYMFLSESSDPSEDASLSIFFRTSSMLSSASTIRRVMSRRRERSTERCRLECGTNVSS